MKNNNMNIINLDQNFKPFGETGEIHIKKCMFPSGIEPHVNVDIIGIKEINNILITHRIESMTDVFEILLTVNALRMNNIDKILRIILFIPYLPFSRQDRFCSPGDSFSLGVFANIINSCYFDNIITIDVHSEISKEYVYNLENILLNKVISFENIELFNNSIIISPDEGSRIRCSNFSGDDEKEIICFSKVRDPKTGELSGFECDTMDFKGKDCIIVDDICSRGGTFMGIAKILKERNAGKVILIVSHCEGTDDKLVADEEELKKSGIEKVYKTNSMNDYESDFVKNIKIKLI